jgi:GNAT superfamily N-acetyltransferase
MSSLASFTVRTAAPEDAALLVEARRHMYEDMGETNQPSLDTADAQFSAWLVGRLEDGRAMGYIAETPDGGWVGALTAHAQDTQPSLGNPSARQHYLFGLWVKPRARRRGVATALVAAAMEGARADGAGLISLNATDTGRIVYGRMGFENNTSMRMFLDPLP